MKQQLLLLVLLLAGRLPTQAQRFFSVEVDSLTRTYLLSEPSQEKGTHLPLIILLHDRHAMPITLARLEWSKLHQPAVIAFPIAIQNRWLCDSTTTDSLNADERFLLRLIFQIQNNFRTDPSRVFIIGMGEAFCLADVFTKRHPALIRAAVRWNNKSPLKQIIPEPAHQFDSLVRTNPGVEKPKRDTGHFAFEQPKKENDSYAHHTTLTFRAGRWQQAQSSRTEFDTVTFTDLSEYHFQFGFEVGYYVTERLTVFVSSDFMIIPKEQNINSISWGGGQGVQVDANGKGGIVIPYGGRSVCFTKGKIQTIYFGFSWLNIVVHRRRKRLRWKRKS
jgi:hypothetical protein